MKVGSSGAEVADETAEEASLAALAAAELASLRTDCASALTPANKAAAEKAAVAWKRMMKVLGYLMLLSGGRFESLGGEDGGGSWVMLPERARTEDGEGRKRDQDGVEVGGDEGEVIYRMYSESGVGGWRLRHQV